jgi:hypothetical protein
MTLAVGEEEEGLILDEDALEVVGVEIYDDKTLKIEPIIILVVPVESMEEEVGDRISLFLTMRRSSFKVTRRWEDPVREYQVDPMVRFTWPSQHSRTINVPRLFHRLIPLWKPLTWMLPQIPLLKLTLQ